MYSTDHVTLRPDGVMQQGCEADRQSFLGLFNAFTPETFTANLVPGTIIQNGDIALFSGNLTFSGTSSQNGQPLVIRIRGNSVGRKCGDRWLTIASRQEIVSAF